jgi:hypothetical protein
MGEITVEEPKTVVDEVTRYECDNCGYVGESDEFSKIRMYGNKTVSEKRGDLCNECVEEDRYVTYMDLQRDKKRIANLINFSFDPFIFGLGMAVAYGVYGGYNLMLSAKEPAPPQIVLWGAIDWAGFLVAGTLSFLPILLFYIPIYAVLSDNFTCLQS